MYLEVKVHERKMRGMNVREGHMQDVNEDVTAEAARGAGLRSEDRCCLTLMKETRTQNTQKLFHSEGNTNIQLYTQRLSHTDAV
jgi:hypothetical protein